MRASLKIYIGAKKNPKFDGLSGFSPNDMYETARHWTIVYQSPATFGLPQESIGHTHVALSVSLMPIPIRHVGRGPARIDWLLLALQNCWSRVFFQSVSLHATLPSPSSRVFG